MQRLAIGRPATSVPMSHRAKAREGTGGHQPICYSGSVKNLVHLFCPFLDCQLHNDKG